MWNGTAGSARFSLECGVSSVTATWRDSDKRFSRLRTSLLSLPQRAGDGAHRRRLRQDEKPAQYVCLHKLDRSGRHEHGHRRSPRNHQSAAGASSARRHFRAAQRRARSAATGIATIRRISRSTMLQAGFALLGPHQSSRSALACTAGGMRVLTSPAQTGAVTLALPQDVQTEAWDYPEDCSRNGCGTLRGRSADRALLKKAIEWIRAARRPLIVAGGGVLLRGGLAGAGGLHRDRPALRLARHRPARVAALRPSAAAGCHRCDRHARRERDGARSRSGYRHRHSL